MTDDEVNQVFNMLDVASLGSQDTIIGSFGLFHAKNASRVVAAAAPPEKEQLPKDCAINRYTVGKQYSSCNTRPSTMLYTLIYQKK